MVNPGTVSGAGTLGSNLENKGSHSKNVEYRIADLGFLHAHSSHSQSSLEPGQPWGPRGAARKAVGGDPLVHTLRVT